MRKYMVFFLFLIACHQAYGQTEEKLQVQIDSLINLSEELTEHLLFSDARSVLVDVISIQEKHNQFDKYTLVLNRLGDLNITMGDYSAADSLLTLALPVAQAKFGENSVAAAKILCSKGKVYNEKQAFVEAKPMFLQSNEIFKNTIGTQTEEYAENLSLLAQAHIYTGKFEEAKNCLDSAELVFDSIDRKNSSIYISLILNKGTYFLMKGDIKNAYEIYTKAQEISEKADAKYQDKTKIYLHLSTAYLSFGLHDLGKKHLQMGIEGIEFLYTKAHPDYAGALVNLGAVYIYTGELHQAEKIYKEAFDIAFNLLGKTHQYYYAAINSLASVYMQQGLLEQAEVYFLESASIRKQLFGEEHISTLTAMNNLGNLYASLNNIEEAEKIFNKNLEISTTQNLLKPKAEALYYLSGIYSANKEYNKALELSKEALNIYEVTSGSLSIDYMKALNIHLHCIVGGLNSLEFIGNVEKKQLEVLDILQSMDLENSLLMSSALTTLGIVYDAQDNHHKALECYLEALEKTPNGQDSYLLLLIQIAKNRSHTDDLATSELYLQDFATKIKNNALNNFVFIPEKERAALWDVYEGLLHFAKIMVFEKATLYDLNTAYNLELFSKNILLTSSNLVQQSILVSKDDELIDNWNQLRIKKNQKIQLEQNWTTDEDLNNIIKQLEKEVVKGSSFFEKMQTQFNFSASDIKAALSKEEVAIEFVLVKDEKAPKSDEYVYYALILSPTSEKVLAIRCCTSAELLTAINEEDYNSLHKLIWQPIEKHLSNAEDIYISPTELLHNVSFYALKDGEKYLSEKYTIHNVLSTKDILRLKNKKLLDLENTNIVLFGGADYNLSHTELATVDSGEYQSNVTRGILDAIDMKRGQGFDYLPGSQKEVELIGNLLKEKLLNVVVYTDKQASESQLKVYSSTNSPDILHLSTHGFYFPLGEKKEQSFQSTKNIYRLSENPLIRSGLVFSGANDAWAGQKNADSITDDGILTAYEVSNLNLSNTKLVVLSACNTGRGDIVNSEGVYGLQRAFKLAGVESLITTLWEISDKDTVEFMTEFYSNWTGGKSMKQSFALAQDKLRSETNADYKKWAGFVLIE